MKRWLAILALGAACGGAHNQAAPAPSNVSDTPRIAVEIIATGPHADAARAELERVLREDLDVEPGAGGQVVRVTIEADDHGCSVSAQIDGGEEFGQGTGSSGGVDPRGCVEEQVASFATEQLLPKLHGRDD